MAKLWRSSPGISSVSVSARTMAARRAMQSTLSVVILASAGNRHLASTPLFQTV
jgi:hypothetical protein